MPSSRPRSRKLCFGKSGFLILHAATRTRSSGTRQNAGSSIRQPPQRMKMMMKGRAEMRPARIPTRCRLMLPVSPRNQTPFSSQCMARAAQATRARCVRSTQCDSRLCSLTEHVDYLLQAYENCPEDPVVCMSLAITSLSRAMQRQADNRHHLIAQVRPVHRLHGVDSESLPGSGVHVAIQEDSGSGHI